MKKFLCPKCKEYQTNVVQWQTASVAHEFDLKTKTWEYNIDTEGGDHECFICPNCGGELDKKFSFKDFGI